MASIVPGFEYDIFISYRQKDNKGDRWVSEFVESLKTELASTFKKDISVYFDVNPHDGLLETHDVDSSLKEKLKCLVFIPVLSRTYCDPESFAWRNEFEAFAREASADKFGLKVKLPNGNVAERILPVRIHDLEKNDIKLYESVTGSILRGIEFIYRTEGVNRPLRAKEDSPGYNLDRTFYRDQVNKTALAVKEIILGLKGEPDLVAKGSTEQRKQETEFYRNVKPSKSKKYRLLAGTIILAAIIVAGIYLFPVLTGRNSLSRIIGKDGRIPVAVMPFQNMTNDTLWNVMQTVIQNNLISFLSNSRELKVRQLETMEGIFQSKGITEYASLTPEIASSVSQNLGTNVYITGSIKHTGSTMRLNALLVDTKTGEGLKSFQIDGSADSMFFAVDSLSAMLKEFLIMSVLKKKLSPEELKAGLPKSTEAFRYYSYGQNAFSKSQWSEAMSWYKKAIAIDSDFVNLASQIIFTFDQLQMPDSAKKWCLRYYQKKDLMPRFWSAWMDYLYSKHFQTPVEEITNSKRLLEIDDQISTFYFHIGWAYQDLEQHEKAIPELEKGLEMDIIINSKPWMVWEYSQLGRSYHAAGKYGKEKELYKEGEKYFPDNPSIIYRQAILALTEGKTKEANEYFGKYESVRKENLVSEANINAGVAGIYAEAGLQDKAEEYYRNALSLEPENPSRLNALGFYLIDKERNVKEGLDLVDKALKMRPDQYLYLDSKGWGLFRMGKNKEALAVLQKADSLKPVYNHRIYLHLEEVKKAVAEMN